MGRYDTIIFDCDGTLSRSDEAYFHGFRDALQKYGFTPPTPQEYQEKYSGKVIRDIIRLYGEGAGTPLPPEVEACYWELEAPYLDRYTTSVTGAREAVLMLQENFRTCVASNASVKLIQYLLKSAALDDLFPHKLIFSSEHVERPKPAPDVFLHALRMMKAMPERSLIIEDSSSGVRAGVAAGVDVIGFAGTSYDIDTKIAQLEAAGAVRVFASWPEIVSFIEKMN